MVYRIIFIFGDGIGLEVIEVVRRVLDVLGVKIEWEVVEVGEKVMGQYGILFFDYVLESVKRNKVVFKGFIIILVGIGFRSVNVVFR